MKVYAKTGHDIISQEEILHIQHRWLLEGDIDLTAFKLSEKYGIVVEGDWRKEMEKTAAMAQKVFDDMNWDYRIYQKLTMKRKAAQMVINPSKVEGQFYPTRKEEKNIRRIWKTGELKSAEKKEVFKRELIDVPLVSTLLGLDIDREIIPEQFWEVGRKILFSDPSKTDQDALV